MADIINIPMIIAIAIWGVGLGVLFALPFHWAEQLRLRWAVGIGGGMLVVEAFFFEGWVRLGFPHYLVEIPEIIQHWIPRPAVELILKNAGVEWASKVLSFLEGISLNGALLQIVPTLSAAARIFCVLPLALAVCTVIGAPLAAIRPGQGFLKICGGILLALSAVACLGLLAVLPELNALGSQGKFQWMLITTLLNTSVGKAPWITLVGLFLLMVEGIIELKDQGLQDPYDFSAVDEGAI